MLKKLSKYWNTIRFFPKSLWLRLSLKNTRQLISGRYSWFALERLGIPGFGTDLIRIDFPPLTPPSHLITEGQSSHRELTRIISETYESQNNLLQRCLNRGKDCLAWPSEGEPAPAGHPWKNNTFLTMLDMISLYGLVTETRPIRYLEIGSGISTRVAAQARKAFSLDMEILSIDPSPRVEVESLCSQVMRSRLEDIPAKDVIQRSGPKTIVFFDGSHRSFPGSDVTVFFLEILPRLIPGTLVHIHDIYLPEDYPKNLLNRYWSEQYLLAAYLLGGGKNLKIVLPCHFLALGGSSKTLLQGALKEDAPRGSSFWVEITE
jgi:hypothetical protein